MLSKVMSTMRLPSPVSVFGTWNATRGFIALRRWSKLSISMSRNFRSATSGSGSAGLPERFAITPMTKGSWIFFSAPSSSTSYSIWTRGARLRAMNFWLLALAISHLLGLLDLAGQLLDRREAVGHQVLHDLEEIHLDEPLRAPDEQRRRIAGLVLLHEAADHLEHLHGIGPGPQIAGTGGARATIAGRLGAVALGRAGAQRRVARLEQARERLQQWREIDALGAADAVVHQRLDRRGALVRLAQGRRDRAIAGERRRDLRVQLRHGPGRRRVLRGGREPAERDFDVARPELPMLARVDQVAVAQVLDHRVGIDERSQRVQPLGRIVVGVGLEQGVDGVPVALEQPVNQSEPGGEARDALGGGQGPRQVDRDAEILAAQQGGLRQIDHLGPVRLLGGLDRVTRALLGLTAGRLLELEEGQVVLEVGTAWRIFSGL